MCALLMTGLLELAALAEEKHSVKPVEGFVSDQRTAIQIAEAVLTSIYGNDRIARERPFSAQLERGVWIVEGQVPQGMLWAVWLWWKSLKRMDAFYG